MPTIQFQDQNNTKINFDSNPSPDDIEEAYAKVTGNQQNQSQQPQQQSGLSDFQNLESKEDIIGKQMVQGGNAPPPESTGQSPISSNDQLGMNVAQFGKAIYENPLVKSVAKPLDQMFNAGQSDAFYSNLPSPKGVMQNISSGVGSAVPMVLATAPIFKATELATGGIAALSKGVPILGRATQILKDSTIAKGYITGLGYGASEAAVMNAQGQNVDVAKHATDTANQFALWGMATRGGATLIGKALGKLPGQINAQEFLSKAPIVGEALKKIYTPEGLGSIAGGMVMGSINAPDQQKGIAGAMVGGAMSAMNPSERFQFQTGMGKTMGFGGISAITDHWGPGFERSNDVFEKEGVNNVISAATRIVQKTDAQGNVMNMAVPQQVEDAHKTALSQIKVGLGNEFDAALIKNENINPTSMNSFLSLLRQHVNDFQDPMSPVAKVFNRVYSSLQGFQPTTTQTEILGNKQDITKPGPSGYTPREAGISSESLTQFLPKKMLEEYQQQLGQKGTKNTQNISSISLNGLHQLKMAMQEMVSPAAYAGARPWEPEERDAAGIAKQISTYIGKQNKAYADVNEKYSQFKDVEGLAYHLNADRLSQNRFNMDDVDGNQRDYELNKISNYLKSQGQGEYDSRRLLDKYYAYQTYKTPTQQAMNKTMPVRVAMTAALGVAGQLTGIPGVGPAASLAAWHYGSPEAWLPLLRGADMAKQSKSK